MCYSLALKMLFKRWQKFLRCGINTQPWIRTYTQRSESESSMEGAILSTASNNRFRTHFKNAASALCARTLPKQRRAEVVASSTARHHTYPRATPPKRAPIACRMEPLICDTVQSATPVEQPPPVHHDAVQAHTPSRPNGTVKLKGTLAR